MIESGHDHSSAGCGTHDEEGVVTTDPGTPRRERVLPSGQVTFAFSDIEGSTRLLQRLGAAYRPLLAEHRALVRAAVEAHTGVVVSYEGDSVFAAFGDAGDAVRGAVAAQRALAEHPWPPGAAIAVRIGLHSGLAEAVDGNYTALAVHQAARVSAAAHGGQTVVSAAVADIVADSLREIGLTLLGEYDLRDFEGPQKLYQADPRGAAREHPALRTPRAITDRVTTDRTPFVGREFDRLALQSQVDQERLVTVVGPGGVGKSRLARKVAADRTADHTDGVWLVDLSGVSDDAGVAGAVAVALGVASGTDDVLTAVVSRLAGSDALLLLDCAERVLTGVAEIATAVLDAGDRVRVLVTSREPLGLAEELVHKVAPLGLPPPDSSDPALVAEHESVRFFLAHAERARPGFTVDAGNAADVVALCRRLDGLPLALRLAAARLGVLSPRQLLDRLDSSFRALGTGARDDPAHHRSLSAAISWSYDALPERDRLVFARLGALPDGGPLEAVEATCASPPVCPEDVLDSLTTLAQRSLVNVSGDALPRWRMLDTVRAFAEARLGDLGELAQTRARYADWLASYVRAEPLDDAASCARLDAEATALRTMLHAHADLPTTTVHRLIAASGGYWLMRSIHEGRDLSLPHVSRDDGDVVQRVEAIVRVAALCLESGQLERGREITAEGSALARSIGDPSLLARSLSSEALFYQRADPHHALTLSQQALAAAEAAGDDTAQALVHSRVAVTAHHLQDWELARRSNEAALLIFRKLGSARGLAVTLFNLAELDVATDPAAARASLDESIGIAHVLGDRYVEAHARTLRGRIALDAGDADGARGDLSIAFELHRALGNDAESAELVSLLAQTT